MSFLSAITTAFKVAKVVETVKEHRGESKGSKAMAAVGAIIGTEGTNPKASQGALKAPMGFSPITAIIEMETVMAGGAHKYGAYNFRDSPIDAMTYIGAIDRHFKLWQDGVDIDEESGQSHLAHIMACCALVIDSMHTEMLVDNRHKSGLVDGILRNSALTHLSFTANNRGVDDDTK